MPSQHSPITVHIERCRSVLLPLQCETDQAVRALVGLQWKPRVWVLPSSQSWQTYGKASASSLLLRWQSDREPGHGVSILGTSLTMILVLHVFGDMEARCVLGFPADISSAMLAGPLEA